MRERRRANLRKLLRARSLAFVGGRGMASTIESARRLGFDGPMWAVSPERTEIAGVRCVPSVADLPAVPDATWIAVRPAVAVEVVRALRAIGAPSAVCYAAGFAETGEAGLERELVAAAGEMALVGPNCMGVINFLDGIGLVVDGHGDARPRSGVACIAQSGTLVGNIVTSQRSLPVSHMLSMGNQAVLDLSDGIDAVTDDPRVSAIALYVEGLTDAEAFAAAAVRAFEAGKPIVALKAGSSEAGRAIARTHTGSLAGTPALYEALFDRLGIVSVPSLPALIEMSKLFALGPHPRGNRVMVETCSGTDSGYCADLADRAGVDLPVPDPAVRAELEKVIPAHALAQNPLDVTMSQWGDREAQAGSLLTLLRQPADAAALVINYPSIGEPWGYDAAVEAMLDVRAATPLPCYVITNLPEGIPERLRTLLIEHRIVPMQGIEDAFTCLGLAARYARFRRRHGSGARPEARLLGSGAPEPARWLDEVESKAALAAFGVTSPASVVVSTVEEAVVAAGRLGGKVVVKGHGATLTHKTELGAVATGLSGDEAVRSAATAISRIEGVAGLLVESMVTDAVAEVIVGVERDPVLGLALVIGSGGVLAELVRDSVSLILPASDDEIRRALESLRVGALLEGYRGRPAGDVDALVRCTRGVARYAEAHARTLIELDVNPVLVRPRGHGALAVDAVVHLGT